MILRITQKLGKKIKTLPTTVVPPGDNPYADWSANLFRAGRTQYIIVSNTTALYSVIFLGKGITTAEAFFDRFVEELRSYMAYDGKESLFKEMIAPSTGEVAFSKNINRSVTGSINEMIAFAAHLMEFEELTPFQLSDRINDSLMSRLRRLYPDGRLSNYGYPREAILQMDLQQPIELGKKGSPPKKKPETEVRPTSKDKSTCSDYWKRIFEGR